MTWHSRLPQLLFPVLLIMVLGLIAGGGSAGTKTDFVSVLINVSIVLSLYVFIGSSGVISFGHISFVAVGAFAAGVMTIPVISKPTVLPSLFPFLQQHSIGNFESLILAALLGMVFAFLAGQFLMRLSGLAAGIATFAVLEITHNVLRFWDKIGSGATTMSLIPETTGALAATVGALVIAIVAFLHQNSRSGRLLRASREDPEAARAIGVNIHRHRLIAFTVSGALAGLAGALLVHQIGSITTEQVYLELTFITLAMLVVGGMSSLWGAVVGASLVSLLQIYLLKAEDSLSLGFASVNLPTGSSLLVLGILMAAILIFRPSGLTGGREVDPVQLWSRLRGKGSAPTPKSGGPEGPGLPPADPG